jgi:predicted metal-dependent hydrolase
MCMARRAGSDEAALIRPLRRRRWGSMSPKYTLLQNQRLTQAPVDSIDYVITQELCHVAEPHDGTLFFKLLNRVLPDWERRKQRLEDIIVSWSYPQANTKCVRLIGQ